MRILLLLATTLSASDYTNDFVIEFDKELDHEGNWGYDFFVWFLSHYLSNIKEKTMCFKLFFT